MDDSGEPRISFREYKFESDYICLPSWELVAPVVRCTMHGIDPRYTPSLGTTLLDDSEMAVL